MYRSSRGVGQLCGVCTGSRTLRHDMLRRIWHLLLRHHSRETGYCCGPERATEENKQLCSKYSVEFGGHASATGLGSAALASRAPSAGGILAMNSGVAWIANYVLAKCAGDPPDANYKIIATPNTPRLTRITSGPNVSTAAAQALDAFYANQVQAFTLLGAFVTSLERAEGAAVARSEEWARRQTLAAADYAAKAATSLKQDQILRIQAVSELQASGFQEISITARDVQNYQREVTARGLPSSLKTLLKQLGLTDQELLDVRSRILAADPNALAGPVFFAALVKPSLIISAYSLAASLEEFAQRAQAAPLRRLR
jgi:hypothetical protein